MPEHELIGRQQETVAVRTFIERARTEAATFLIEGEAGIGKTSLWRAGLATAQGVGLRVSWCAVSETEAKASFSALSDLVEPIADELGSSLPDPQRRALEVVLLRSDPAGRPLNQRAVATAFRSLLLAASEAAPTLIAIDDVQWVDASSARAIEFALRRLKGARVSLLASRRSGSSQQRDGLVNALSDPERLDLGRLSLAATHELIRRRLGRSIPRPLLLRVHEAARGNPFFALEIARVVIDQHIEFAEPLPVPANLAELVRRRVRRLSPSSREAVLAVAVAAQPTRAVISAAIGRDAEADLEEAEAAGLLTSFGEVETFTHPLYAAAVYSSSSPERRRTTHRQLARAVSDPEQQARHLALAVPGPDESVASALNRAAGAAKRRGADDAAAELLELAVRLTPSSLAEDLARRSLELGEVLRLTGDPEGAQRVLEKVASSASSALTCRALIELAAVSYWSDGPVAAVQRLDAALRAAKGDVALKAKAHADLAVYCDFDLERSYRHARTAVALLEQLGERADPLDQSEAIAIAARGSLMLGHGLPVEQVDRAITIEARAPERSLAVAGRVSAFSGQWLNYIDDFDGARRRLEEARRQALEEGDESALPNILGHLAQTELWSGRWETAADYADESCLIAERLGVALARATSSRALVDAHRGEVERARTTALAGLDREQRNPLAAPLYLRVLGFLSLSIDDPREAERYLSTALAQLDEVKIREPAVLRIHADAVEAMIEIGDISRAESIVRAWEKQAARSDLAWSLATSARSRALVQAARGEVDGAIAAVERALREHQRVSMPFELGRTLFVKGRIERRAKRKASARASLEQALAVFDGLPAPLWAARAEEELRRVGLRPRTAFDLTETETRVAELAASGLKNREVAAQLYISPKTVEANLARVYGKLGIRSRAELGSRLGRMGMGAPEG